MAAQVSELALRALAKDAVHLIQFILGWHLAWQGSFGLFYCVYYATLCVGIGEWQRPPSRHARLALLGLRAEPG